MKDKKGFTLVELLAVIAILAVLVLLAMPNVLKLFNEAKKSSFITEAQEIAKTTTSKYVKESLIGKRVNKISSEDDTKLDLSGGDVDYYLELDNKGNITFLEVSNDSFCLQTDKDYKDITKEDVTDGKCDPLNRLTPEEREILEKAKIAEEKYKTNSFLKVSSPSKIAGISEIDKLKVKRIYTVASNEVPENTIGSWDASQAQNGSIMMWELPSDTDGMFDLYIGQEDGVIANENSYYLFEGFENTASIDVSNLITSKVKDMFRMFYECNSVQILDLSGFDTSNVTNMRSMFSVSSSNSNYGAINIIFGPLFNTSKVTDMNQMFYGLNRLQKLDVSHFDTSNVEKMSGMFLGLKNVDSLDVSHFNTQNVTDMSDMFLDCGLLQELNLSSFNTLKVTNMFRMFYGCKSLQILDLGSFDTSNVEKISHMFDGCSSLKNINLSSFNTSKVTNMSSMFYGCKSLQILDLSSFDTKLVENMRSMFSMGYAGNNNNYGPTQIIFGSLFNTQNVTDMYDMFYGCSNLEYIDVSKFNTSNVVNMSGMFEGVRNVDLLDLTGFDTSKVEDMSKMFVWTKTSIVNLSAFDTTNVTNMTDMFNYSSIDKIIIPNRNGNTTNKFNGNGTSVSGSFILAE